MTRPGPRFFAFFLLAWGLFNMGFPLWKAAEATIQSGEFSPLPIETVAAGLTAVLAGLGLWAVGNRRDPGFPESGEGSGWPGWRHRWRSSHPQ